MDDERVYFQSAEDASGSMDSNNEDTTESLTLTLDDYKITENAMIGVGLGGSALIVSICVLGLISLFRRV